MADWQALCVRIEVIRREEAPKEEPLGLKSGENLLALSHTPPGASLAKIVRSMGNLIADQRGYGALQVKLTLDQMVAQSGMPSVYGGTLAFFHGQMIGLLEPLLVVAVIPASPAVGRSQVRHVILQLGLSVPSAAELILIHRLVSCLRDPEAIRELLRTRSSPELAEALLSAVRPHEPSQEGSAKSKAKAKAKEDGTNSTEEVMPETHPQEINYNLVQVWIDRAEKNAPHCNVCQRVAKSNRESGEFATLRICGVEFSPESQIAHLSRCVGEGTLSA